MQAPLKQPLTPESCQAVHLGKGFKSLLQAPSVSLWDQTNKQDFTA